MMQREIKFKFWEIEAKKMHDYTNEMVLCVNFSKDINSGWIPLQYTGLKDKNNKEICEGDIIQYDDYRGVIVWSSGGNGVIPGFDIQLEKVNRDSERYIQYRHDKNYKLIQNFPENVEVIGNIYENPELLGDKNENQV